MAHNYVVTGITHLGDNATVNGTVDGIPVSVNCNWSAITGLGSILQFEAFIAPLMLAQVIPPSPTVDNTHNGSWSA